MSNKLASFITQQIGDPKRDWSIRELARRAGLSSATIVDVLNSKRKPGLRFYLGISRALNVSVERLLALTGEIPPKLDLEEDLVVAELVEITRNLSPMFRESLLSIARKFRETDQELGPSTHIDEYIFLPLTELEGLTVEELEEKLEELQHRAKD